MACRSDLSNSLLSATVYLAHQPVTTDMHSLLSSCLSSFLTGAIHDSYAQLSAATGNACSGYARDVKEQLASEAEAAAAAGVESGSDYSSAATEMTADADIIDDYLKAPSMHCHWRPLTLVVGMPALPKGALVEVQPEACTVEAMTHQQSSHGSSDSEEEGADPQAGSSHWAARLVKLEGTLQSPSKGYWSSLVSYKAYLCCQLTFDTQCDNLDGCVGCIVDNLTDRLADAGLIPSQHLMSLTMYGNALASSAAEFCSCFGACWMQKHGFTAPMLCVPVWLMMTGLGAEIQATPQSYAFIKLTAHQCNEG